MKLLLFVTVGSVATTTLFIACLLAWSGWDMSVHGWIALGLGTFLSLLLGAGLMALMFHSARQGYDDRIELDRIDEPE